MKKLKVFDSLLQQELEIFVGQNAQDNWNIIDMANPYDIWFHVSEFPSSHVILKLPNKDSKCNGQTLQYCASLCKKHSKMKNDNNKIKIVFTEIRNLAKGEKVGQVIITKTRIMLV